LASSFSTLPVSAIAVLARPLYLPAASALAIPSRCRFQNHAAFVFCHGSSWMSAFCASGISAARWRPAEQAWNGQERAPSEWRGTPLRRVEPGGATREPEEALRGGLLLWKLAPLSPQPAWTDSPVRTASGPKLLRSASALVSSAWARDAALRRATARFGVLPSPRAIETRSVPRFYRC
jgi:hypothetical protein